MKWQVLFFGFSVASLGMAAPQLALSIPSLSEIDPAACLQGKVEFSLENQIPARVHDQKQVGRCYAHAFSVVADAALYRETGNLHDISPEFAVCQYLQKAPAGEVASLRDEFLTARLNGEHQAGFALGGSPEVLVINNVVENSPVVDDSPETAQDLEKILDKLGKETMMGKLYSKVEACRIVDKGLRQCTKQGTVKLRENVFKNMTAGGSDMPTQIGWLNNARLFTSRIRTLGESATDLNAYEELTQKCEAYSENVRKMALEHLCSGIPLMARTILGNVETAPLGSRNYTREPFSKDFRQEKLHEMALMGVERDPVSKKPYFIFRNSEGPATAKVRIAFSEACRIWGLSWILTPSDELRLRSRTPPKKNENSGEKPVEQH